ALVQGPRGFFFLLCPAALGAAHQDAAPAVGGGIADRAEERSVRRRVKRSGAEREGRVEREALGVREPGAVVFEACAFAALAYAGPEPPRQVGLPFQIGVDEDLPFHLPSLPLSCAGGFREGVS